MTSTTRIGDLPRNSVLEAAPVDERNASSVPDFSLQPLVDFFATIDGPVEAAPLLMMAA